MEVQGEGPEPAKPFVPDRDAELGAAIDEIERALARLDALGLTTAAAHVSFGLDAVRSHVTKKGGDGAG